LSRAETVHFFPLSCLRRKIKPGNRTMSEKRLKIFLDNRFIDR